MSLRVRNYIIQLTLSIITALLWLYGNYTWFEVISVGLFIFFMIKLAYDMGYSISVKNIIALIATMQWLLGPFLGYKYNDLIPTSYQMVIDKNIYFSYALPACIAYFIGIYLPIWKTKRMFDFKNYEIDYYHKGVFFIIAGFIGGFLPLGFLSYLLGGLKYVGLFYMYGSKNSLKYHWIIPVFGFLVYKTLASGMFHELILWGSFFMMLYFLFVKIKFRYRLFYLFVGLFLILSVQLIKRDYRSNLGSESVQDINYFKLLQSSIQNKFSHLVENLNDNIASNTVRINQGWIISRVMNHIPANEPFANGKSVAEALEASLLPRFIDPNKPIAGGRSNMERYAGIELNEFTSMDISQLGEAYANFGAMGGIIFMFILGLFFNWVISFLERKCLKYPDLIFWIPLIFLQGVKAETSMVTVINHIAKASFVTWIFFSPWGNYFINKFFVRGKKHLQRDPLKI